MEDGVAILNFDDLPVRENDRHAVHETVPLTRTPKIVHHQKAAAQQVFANFQGLGFSKLPVAHFAHHHPRPVVEVATIIRIYGLLHGPGMDAGEAAHGHGKITVRARVILRPAGAALAPVTIAAEAEGFGKPALGVGRVHEASLDPLGFLLIIGGQADVVEGFEAGIDAKRTGVVWRDQAGYGVGRSTGVQRRQQRETAAREP